MLTFEETKIYGAIERRGHWIDGANRRWELFASDYVVGGYNTWRMRICKDCSSRVIVPHLGI